ncbi:MAG TPA: ABC transporter substrate-binding protein [Armatimonadota bacterium]|nr:ABC transporter substrate-binding protein [Armatimonadota bacterium]
MRVGTTQDADNLNPFIGYSVTAYQVYHLNYDLLVGYAPNGDSRPELATSWTVSTDGLQWTFKLREDVKWHDGVPFTARDVAFTYNYIIDNDLAAFSTFTKGIDKAVAVDDMTVKFYLRKPKANMLRLWIPIVPEHIWSKISGEEASAAFQNRPPIVGTGPFKTVEAKKGSFIRMEANKDYWGGAPDIDELIIQVYTNQDTMTMDLKGKVIDAAVGLPVGQFESLKKVDGIAAVAARQRYFTELAMNCYTGPSLGNPVLKDVNFRRAISWCVDKEKLIDTCWGGYADRGDSILAPGTDYAWQPSESERFGYDLDKATELLAEAGYRDTDGDQILNDLHNANRDIKLRLWTREESPEQQRAGKLIAGALESVGIDIELSVMNDGAISDGIYNYEDGTYKPNFDMFIWGWQGSADPDYQLADFVTDQIEMWNDCCWSNERYDKLRAQESTETDPARREQEVVEMQKIFYESAPYVVIAYPRKLVAYDCDQWEGWVPYPGKEGDPVFSYDNVDTYVKLAVKTGSESGGGSGGIVAVVIVVVIVAAIVVFILVRRRTREAEEE